MAHQKVQAVDTKDLIQHACRLLLSLNNNTTICDLDDDQKELRPSVTNAKNIFTISKSKLITTWLPKYLVSLFGLIREGFCLAPRPMNLLCKYILRWRAAQGCNKLSVEAVFIEFHGGPQKVHIMQSMTPLLTEEHHHIMMVGRGGLEPPTSRLSGVRSNRAELPAPTTSL